MTEAIRVAEPETGHDPHDFSDIALPTGRAVTESAEEGPSKLVHLLGGYAPIPGHDNLFYQKPKLRRKLEMAAEAEQFSAGTLNNAAGAEKVIALLASCCTIKESGEVRQATADDLLDNLDEIDEITTLMELLGIAKKEADGSPNG